MTRFALVAVAASALSCSDGALPAATDVGGMAPPAGNGAPAAGNGAPTAGNGAPAVPVPSREPTVPPTPPTPLPPPVAQHLDDGNFDLVGIPPEGGYVAVIAHPGSELRVYDPHGFVARLSTAVVGADPRVTAGAAVYFEDADGLKGWWPSRGSAGPLTLTPSYHGNSLDVRSDGKWIAFVDDSGLRFGPREAPGDSLAAAGSAKFAPGAGHLYLQAAEGILRIPRDGHAADAVNVCPACGYFALSDDGTRLVVERATSAGSALAAFSTDAAGTPIGATPGRLHDIYGFAFSVGGSSVVYRRGDGASNDTEYLWDLTPGDGSVIGSGDSFGCGPFARSWLACGGVCTCYCHGSLYPLATATYVSSVRGDWEVLDRHADDRYLIERKTYATTRCGTTDPVWITVGRPAGEFDLPPGSHGPAAFLDQHRIVYTQGPANALLLVDADHPSTTQTLAEGVKQLAVDEVNGVVYFVSDDGAGDSSLQAIAP